MRILFVCLATALLHQLCYSGIHLTIYQRDLVLVEDTRTVEIEKGNRSYRFEGLFSGLFVSTLQIEGVPPIRGLTTKSIQFFPDNMSLEAMFLESIGSWVSFFSGRDRIEGKLLSVTDDHLIIQSDTTVDHVDFYEKNSLGWVTFDGNQVSKKSITSAVWNYTSEVSGKFPIRIRYVVNGLNWRSNHRIVRNSDNNGLLSSNFSIENTSYTNFIADSVRLVAGYPYLSTDQSQYFDFKFAKNLGFETSQFTQSGFQVYSLQEPVTFLSRQALLVPYLDKIPTQIQEEYIISSPSPNQTIIQSYWHITPSLPVQRTLAWGEISLYSEYQGKEIFCGEGYAPFVFPNGSFSILVNQVVTATVQKSKVETKKTSNGSILERYHYEIQHSEKKTIRYRILEKFYGNWEVQNSPKSNFLEDIVRKDATTLEIVFTMPPNSKRTIDYEIVYQP
ncbi:MAG: hypothetical protein N2450_09400 [bacterium]|nr:hypothetical protein [bacterium]